MGWQGNCLSWGATAGGPAKTSSGSFLISFIIPLFNHLDQSKEMLATLLRTLPKGLDFEAILIDDASTDGTAAWLRQLRVKRVRVMVNKANLGFAKTNNKAIAAARGQILGLLNNDLVLTPGWLEPMLAVLQAPRLNAGLVGNVQRRVADNAIDHAGVHVGADGKLAHLQTLPESPMPYQRVWAATGACCLVRKSDFDALGGFDEGFVNGGEDVDLCMRLRQAGKHIYVALQSQVGHHVSLSRGRVSVQNEINSRRLQAKWRPELKREVVRLWAAALNNHGVAQLPVDGTLLPAFVATPRRAAGVLAENMLLREECRWQRMLDHTEPNAGMTTRHSTSGPAKERVARLQVKGLRSARNFYVCGHRAQALASPGRVELTIRVNGIQQKTFTLGPGAHFNLGLINPLVLPDVDNEFCVTVKTTGAARAVVITHFVLDDQTMELQPEMTTGFNLLDLILTLRPDLCEQFGFDTARGRPGFAGWLVTSGLKEYKALADDPGFRALLRGARRGKGALTGLQQLLWQLRPDVQKEYPLPARQAEYLHWFYCHGVGEHGVWPVLEPADKALALQKQGPWQASFQALARADALQRPAPPWRQRPWGVNVVGYAYGQLGIGEDARMAAMALQAAGVPMCMVNFEPGADIAQNDMSMQAHVVPDGPHPVNLFCLTALEHGRFYAERGVQPLQGRYNIGYWPWELSQWPAQWRQLVHLVDEVWVSSRHTFDAVAPLCRAQKPPVPVYVMPMAVDLGPVAAPGGRTGVRKRFGLPRTARLFCFSFDLNSSVHRKNPQAVVDAFLRAFPADQWSAAQVGLVIKVHPPTRPNPAWDALKALAAQDDRLHVIEQTLPRPALLGLYQACDCFVSLHRAEGFGRGIAEVLQLGLHVITTGYSGNLDFCQAPEMAGRVDLVQYRLVKLKPGQYPYADGQVWANADVGHAAQCMAAFVGRFPPGAGKAGGPPHVPPPQGWPVFSPLAVGQRYQQRLHDIAQLPENFRFTAKGLGR